MPTLTVKRAHWPLTTGCILLLWLPPLIAVSQSAKEDVSAFATLADSLIQGEVAKENIPGAVLLVARGDDVLYEKAYGFGHLYEYGKVRLDKPEEMTTNHLFDLASMTKVLAATLAIMRLKEDGLVQLDDPVNRYLPGINGPSKDSITVRHLLCHSAGLYQWQPLYLYTRTRKATLGQIASMPLRYPVGKERHYSDLGFMLLGYIVERVSGKSLDEFLKEEVYDPAGLTATLFNANKHLYIGPIAATSFGNPYEYKMVSDTTFGYRVIGDPNPDIFEGWRKYTLKGETNDGNAFYANEGVAGHAGLFSTVEDIHRLFLMMLNEGEVSGRRILKKETVRLFLQKNEFDHGLGWQWWNLAGKDEDPVMGFGHSGFTGTHGVCIPDQKLIVILLTNRQNVGQNSKGYYPNVGPLNREVSRAALRLLRAKPKSN